MSSFMLFLWIAVAAFALIIDLITSSFLFIWFTIGAITAILAEALGYSTPVQVVTFIAVSALFLAVGYPLVKETIKKTVPKTATMEENYIGREITAEEDIISKATLKIDGIYWTMKNVGETVRKGEKAKIVGIEGNKLLIQKM